MRVSSEADRPDAQGAERSGHLLLRCKVLAANPVAVTACADRGEMDVDAAGIVARLVPGRRPQRAGASMS